MIPTAKIILLCRFILLSYSLITSRFDKPKSFPILKSAVSQKNRVENLKWTTVGYRKPLHWVVKVGSLEKTLQFYSDNFALNIFRHEEFATGCEATCNGPYGGAWSKTMIGAGTSEQHAFALELTSNYGIENYERGNDLRYLAMDYSGYLGPKESILTDTTGRKFLKAPDHWIHLVDGSTAAQQFPFDYVSIHVSNITRSVDFYQNVLGAALVCERPGMDFLNQKTAFVTWSSSDSVLCNDEFKDTEYKGVSIELVELPAGKFVERAEAFGRFAIETEDRAPFYMAARVAADSANNPTSPGRLAHGPLKLQPHGEEVSIIQDPDGHEYCFVDARGYEKCTDVGNSEEGRKVNWNFRMDLERKAAASLTTADLEFGPEIEKVDAATFSERVLALAGDAVLEVYAPWCALCSARKEVLGSVAAKLPQVRFFAVNGGSTKTRDNCDFPLSSMVEWTQLKGFPGLFLLQGDKMSPIAFDDSWRVDAIGRWLLSHGVAAPGDEDADSLFPPGVGDEVVVEGTDDDDDDCDSCSL